MRLIMWAVMIWRGEAETWGRGGFFGRFSVSPCLRVSVSLRFGQSRLRGKEHIKARALRKCSQNFIRYGFGRILVDLPPTNTTVSYSHPSVEEAKVIEDFSLR